MAVTKMEKVTVIADKNHQEAILQTFQGLQNVEIRDLSKSNESNAWVNHYFSGSFDQLMDTREGDLDQLQSRVQEALQFIDYHGTRQKQKGEPLKRQYLSLQELEQQFDEQQFRAELSNILGLKKTWEVLEKKKADLEKEEEWLSGWQYLDVNPNEITSKFTTFKFVTVSDTNLEAFVTALKELDTLHLEEVYHGAKDSHLAFVHHNAINQQVQELMNQYSVVVEEYPYNLPPKEMLAQVKDRLAATIQEIKELAKNIGAQQAAVKRLQWSEEVVLARKAREHVKNQYVKSRYLVVLQGWISVLDKADLLAEIENQLGKDEVYISFEEPTRGEIHEEVPTKLKNNALVQPFEMLTEMYSLPKYEEVDPTPWMVPFYLVFFGMMVADVGYGLLMLVATIVAQKFLVLPKGMARFAKFFQILSIPSMIWGFIYASFFGLALPYTPILSTTDDVIQILILSVVFGFIQIMVGLFVAAKEHIKRKEYLDAIGNGFVWQGILAGIAIAIVGSMLVQSDTIMMLGAAIAVISAIGVLVIPVIQSKSKVKGFAKGAYALYGVTGYIGDLVSYTRLMALGISGGSIAAAFNLLVAYLPTAARFTVGILLIVALHALNIFLTLLSAYVHGARLQYVEFFGKFYTGGGRNFSPLKTEEKYINIERKKK